MNSARDAVTCSILCTELPLLERPAAARSAGFGAVEFGELTDVHNPVPTVSGPRQLVGRD